MEIRHGKDSLKCFFREIQLMVEFPVGAGIPSLCQIYNHWHKFVARNQLKSFQRGYRYYEMLTLLNVDPNLKIDLSKKYSIGIL